MRLLSSMGSSTSTDYLFEIREAMQLVNDGKQILAADQYSIWLLNLRPEALNAN